MKKIKENINLIIYFFISCILIFIMFWAIGQKQGFHEDEIFSYGASNSSLASTLVAHGKEDVMDVIMHGENIFETIKNVLHYKVFSSDDYGKEVDKLMAKRPVAIWRTQDDAKEYLQIDNFKEAINFRKRVVEYCKRCTSTAFLFCGSYSFYSIFWKIFKIYYF